jgi:TP901 family phage tail tape measure protein
MANNKYQVDIDIKLDKSEALSDMNKILRDLKEDAVIEIDIKGSTKKLTDLKNALKGLSNLDSTSLKEVNAQIDKLGDNLGKLATTNAKSLNSITAGIRELGTELTKINKLDFGNLSKLATGVEKLAKSFNQMESIDLTSVNQLRKAITEVKSGLTGLGQTKIDSFTGLNQAISGAIKQLNKMKNVTVEDIIKMEETLEAVGRALKNTFNLDTAQSDKFIRNIEQMVRLLEQVNRMDASTLNTIVTESDVEMSGKEKRLLNEILKLKKQMATTVDASSYADLKQKLNDAENELSRMGSTFKDSQSHMYSWEKFADKTFDNVKKKTTDLNTQLAHAFEMNIIDENKLQDLNKLKEKLEELNKIKLKGEHGEILNEAELRQASQWIQEIQQGMRRLRVDQQSINLFEGFQGEAQTVMGRFEQLKEKMEALKRLRIDPQIGVPDEEFQRIEEEIIRLNNLTIDADTTNMEQDLQRVNTDLAEIEHRIENGLRNRQIDLKADGVIRGLLRLKGISDETDREIDTLVADIRSLQNTADSQLRGTLFRDLQNQANDTVRTVERMQREIQETSEASSRTTGLWGTLSNAVNFYAPVSWMVEGIRNSVDGVFESIRDLDSAFRDLKKVAPDSFSTTTESLEQVRVKAGQVASEVASTTTDVINATAKALQMGIKNMDDAVEYAKNSAIYSNVADLNQEDADKQLTSILSAYGGIEKALQPMREEVQGATKDYNMMTQYMDLANHAGNNFAVTSGDIGKAFANSASIFKTTGTNIGEAISYIVGANETVQNANKVGTSLKAIGTNLVGLKTSAKDGSISLNKTALALKKVGISSQKSNGDVKSTSEILNELGEIWGGLGTKNQMALAEAIAGKNHINTLTALMNNWETVLKYQEDYNNGSYVGSAEKENARYIDSIEGKLTQLKENVTQLVTTVIKTDMFKDILDGANAFLVKLKEIVEFLDRFGIALPTIIGAGVGLKQFISAMGKLEAGEQTGQSIFGSGAVNNVRSLVSAFRDGVEVMDTTRTSSNQLINVTDQVADSVDNVADAMQQSGQQATRNVRGFAGVKEALKGMFSASSLATVAMSALNAGIVALGSYLLGKGIQAVDDYVHRYENLVKKSQEAQQETQAKISGIKEEKANLKSLADEYTELQKKQEKTEEDEQRILELRQELAELSPNLVTGWDKEGNPIIELGDALDSAIEKYDIAIERQEKLLQLQAQQEAKGNTKLANEGGSKLASSREGLEGTEIGIGVGTEQVRNQLEARKKLYDDYFNDNIDAYNEYVAQEQQIQSANMGKLSNSTTFNKLSKDYQSKIKELGNSLDWGKLTEGQQNTIVGALSRLGEDVDKIDLKGFQTHLSNLNEEYSNGSLSADVYNEKINKMAENLGAVIGVDPSILVTALQEIPNVMEAGSIAQGEFFRNFNANLGQIDKTKLATMLNTQWEEMDSVQQLLYDSIDSEEELTGKKKINVELLTQIENENDLPLQIQGAIEGALADGDVDEFETEIIMRMMAEYQQNGEISKETLDEYLELVKDDRLTAETEFKLTATADDNMKKYIFNGVLDNMSEKERKVITEFKTLNKDELKEIEDNLRNMGLSEADIKEKMINIVADAEFEREQNLYDLVGVLDELGFDDDKIESYLLKFTAENSGIDISKLKTVEDYIIYFKQNPELATKYGIKVEGDDKLESLKKKLNELAKTEAEKDIVKNIVTALKQGNSAELESELQKLEADRQVDFAVVLKEDTVSDTLEGLMVHEMVEKNFVITDNGSGLASKKSVNEVDGLKVEDKYFKIHDGGSGRSAYKSANQVKSMVNSIPSNKVISISVSGYSDSVTKLKYLRDLRLGAVSIGNLPTAISKNPFDLERSIPSNAITPSNLFNDAVMGVQGSVDEASDQLANAGSTFSAQALNTWGSISTSKYYYKYDMKYLTKPLQENIELFTALNNAVKRVQNNLALCEAKMENAFGKNKQTYLSKSITLLKNEQSLLKDQFKAYNKEATSLQKKLKGSGFKFDSRGNVTNYEKKMVAYEKELDRLEKKANAKKASTKTKNAYENYQKKVENIKTYMDEYLNLQFDQIPSLQTEWQELATQIREYQDELEQNKFEQKIYKEVHALESLNNRLELASILADRYGTRADNTFGTKRITNLKKQNEYLAQQEQYMESIVDKTSDERDDYRSKLKKYGLKWNDAGTLTNQDTVLNKLYNTDDYEKVKAWIEEYNELGNTLSSTKNDIVDIKYEQQQLAEEIKKAQLDERMVKFNLAIKECDNSLAQLSAELDKIDSQLEYAFGSDMLNLMDDKLDTLNQSLAETEDKLKNLKRDRKEYQKELEKYGFDFDTDGSILNYSEIMKGLKDSDAYDYVQSVYDEWENVHNSSIPQAEKSIRDYANTIKDVNKEKLTVTQNIEKQITDMYKDQLEKRKDELEKQTKAVTEELEKQRQAYKDSREEAKYEDEYNEQLSKVQELQDKIDNLRLSDSLADKSKLADLMKELEDEQKALEDLVQDKIDSDVDKMYEDQIKAVEEGNEKALEKLEEDWTDQRIAEMVAEALGTGIFTDIYGNVTDLQSAMLSFSETSGEAFGVMGKYIQEELIANLNVALASFQDLESILQSIGLSTKGLSSIPGATASTTGSGANKTLNLGDINISVQGDMSDEATKKLIASLQGTLDGIVERL